MLPTLEPMFAPGRGSDAHGTETCIQRRVARAPRRAWYNLSPLLDAREGSLDRVLPCAPGAFCCAHAVAHALAS